MTVNIYLLDYEFNVATRITSVVLNSFGDYSPQANCMKTKSRLDRISCLFVTGLPTVYKNNEIYKSVYSVIMSERM